MVRWPKQENPFPALISAPYMIADSPQERTPWKCQETCRPRLLQGLSRNSPHAYRTGIIQFSNPIVLDITYGAMITLAPACGICPTPSMFSSTLANQSLSCCFRVGPSSVYHDPAWLAPRIVIEYTMFNPPTFRLVISLTFQIEAQRIISKVSDQAGPVMQIYYLRNGVREIDSSSARECNVAEGTRLTNWARTSIPTSLPRYLGR